VSPLPNRISRVALNDLEEIWLYTMENWSVEQANRYHQLIIDEVAYICKNRNSGKSIAHIRDGYRSSKVKSHLIFYKIENNVIHVARILHEIMDVQTKLYE
jgi:toxin ParE1/3/4